MNQPSEAIRAAEAPPPSAPPVPILSFEETELDRVVSARGEEIALELRKFCRERRVNPADADQAVGETFAVAFDRERQGRHWDPKVHLPVTEYLQAILVDNVLRKLRRSYKRKPTSELGADDAMIASEAPLPDVLLAEHEEHALLAAAVRKALTKETRTGLVLRILDAMQKGIEDHGALADALECSLEDVRAAFKRIRRRLEAFQASA